MKARLSTLTSAVSGRGEAHAARAHPDPLPALIAIGFQPIARDRDRAGTRVFSGK